MKCVLIRHGKTAGNLAGRYIGKYRDDAISTKGKDRNHLIVISGVELDASVCQLHQLRYLGNISACFLDANDILDILCKSYCGLRLDITSGTGRYVVHDNRKAYGLCHCSIVSNQTLLGRLIIIRGYYKQSVRAVFFCFLRQIDCSLGAVRAGA